ncbi:MAG: B12-binding domain-containing radical SAM protein [Elusimicrobiales bacterium]|nr:B12-binding domain-containing radical SAM protein [Elusimicrobiales bacterium]
MKILLIQAKIPEQELNAISLPIGLMSISSYCKNNGYDNIKIISLDIDSANWEQRLIDYAPDVVGIGSIVAQGRSLYEIASFVKKNLKSKVICGGAYPTYSFNEILNNKNIDFCVIGEGEIPFLKILSYFDGKISIDEVPSIAYKKNDKIIINEKKEIIDNLDDLPFLDYSSVDIIGYRKKHIPCSIYAYGKNHIPYLTSRGCPYRCIYCHKIQGCKFRAHSPERIIADIKKLHNLFGSNVIEIVDDIANFDINRFKKLLLLIKEELYGIDVYFSGGLSINRLDEESIDLMKEAGIKYFAVGIESGSARIQKLINKNINLNRAKKLISYASNKRIFIHGLFMIGFPFEKETDIKETIKFASSLQIHTMLVSTCFAYPGTELSKMLPEKDVKNIYTDTIHYSRYEGFIPNINGIPYSKIKKYKFLMNLKFYYSPKRIYRILRDLPNRNIRLLNLLLKKLIERTFPFI